MNGEANTSENTVTIHTMMKTLKPRQPGGGKKSQSVKTSYANNQSHSIPRLVKSCLNRIGRRLFILLKNVGQKDR